MCLSRERTGPNGPTVLVVEDNPDLNALWQRYLNLMGCHVVSARRGEEALALAQESELSAVILDIMLPGMDGWQVLQALKKKGRTRQVPVVMCSALDGQARSVSEGAEGYLRKPVRYADFKRVLTDIGVRSN